MVEVKEFLGLDVGQKRTGIARASSIAKLAEPLKTVETVHLEQEIGEIAASHNIEAIVVGLPRNLSGEDTDQTKWVREWVAKAKKSISIPFFWQDEALTTKMAEGKDIKNTGVDSVAASIILQDFLDNKEADS